MFQASSVYKICKWNQRAAFGNYSGSGWLGSAWLTCDYKAISVQLQLQLPTGTELGNSLSGCDPIVHRLQLFILLSLALSIDCLLKIIVKLFSFSTITQPPPFLSRSNTDMHHFEISAFYKRISVININF